MNDLLIAVSRKRKPERLSVLKTWLKKHAQDIAVISIFSSILGIIGFPMTVWSFYHPGVVIQTVTETVKEYIPDPRQVTITLTPSVTVSVTRFYNTTVTTTTLTTKTMALSSTPVK